MEIQVSSDKFHQLKPHQQPQVEQRIESSGKFAPFVPKIAYNESVIEAYRYITYTNLDVLNLLKKAISIVSETEAYTGYLLEQNFGEKFYWGYMPPGTIRIYAQNLICFYNGHNWRKLKP